MDRDEYLQPLTFVYNMQVHGPTETTLIDLMLTRYPSSILVTADTELVTGETEPEDQITPVQLKRATLLRLWYALQTTKERLTKAQKWNKEEF